MNAQLTIFPAKRARRRYFNTVNESAGDVAAYIAANKYQDSKILNFLLDRRDKGKDFTSDELHDHFPGMLLTSIRRSMNTLMKLGWVEKTGKKRMGSLGRNALVWRLNQKT